MAEGKQLQERGIEDFGSVTNVEHITPLIYVIAITFIVCRSRSTLGAYKPR